jgi:hypothetical protein
MEQLLATDAKLADRRQPLGRDEKRAKAVRGSEFRSGVFARVELDDVVAVDQVTVALDDIAA